MKEDVKEIGAIQGTIARIEQVAELNELELALVGGGFGEVVLV